MASTLDLVHLERSVAELRQEVAELRSIVTRRRKRPTLLTDPEGVLTDAMSLHERLCSSPQAAIPERMAKRVFGADVVNVALDERLVYRDPGYARRAGSSVLTVLGPTATTMNRIVALLADGPQPLAIIREAPGVNRNTVNDIILRGVHEGHFRRGTLRTGKAGRPQQVIALANRPLPTHWDTHKVDWDRA